MYFLHNAVSFLLLGKLAEFFKDTDCSLFIEGYGAMVVNCFTSGLGHSDLTIRVEALKSLSNFLVTIKDKKHVAGWFRFPVFFINLSMDRYIYKRHYILKIIAFQHLVEPMAGTIAFALQSNDETAANECLKSLIEVATCTPDFMRSNMSSLGRFLINFTSNSQLNVSSRKLCLELMISLSEVSYKCVTAIPSLFNSYINFCRLLLEWCARILNLFKIC